MYHVIHYGREDMIECLVNAGADLDIRYGKEGKSCTHLLEDNFRTNLIDVIKLIIEKGAEVNIADHESRTPLHYAAMAKNVEMVMLLLEGGANLPNPEGGAPLHCLAKDYNIETMELLMKNGATMLTISIIERADVSWEDAEGMTLLHITGEQPHPAIAPNLVD